MAAKIICDGCGKEVPMESNGQSWFKPASWFERSDKDGIQTACSRKCIEKISKESGKTGVVLPV